MTTERILFLIIWYVATTAGASFVTSRYDRWITRAHDADARDATRRVVPTSFLVVAGVAGVELFKMLRAFPISIIVGEAIGFNGLVFALVATGSLLLDSMITYIAAGWPMISGDLHRETRALDEAEAIATERIAGQSDRLSLYQDVRELAEIYGAKEAIDALEELYACS